MIKQLFIMISPNDETQCGIGCPFLDNDEFNTNICRKCNLFNIELTEEILPSNIELNENIMLGSIRCDKCYNNF